MSNLGSEQPRETVMLCLDVKLKKPFCRRGTNDSTIYNRLLGGNTEYSLVGKWLNKWQYIHTAKLHRRVKISALALSVATEKSLQLLAE